MKEEVTPQKNLEILSRYVIDAYDSVKVDCWMEGLEIEMDRMLEEETEDERQDKMFEAQLRDYEAEHGPIGELDEDDIPF